MDLQQWYFKIITTLEELFSLVELCIHDSNPMQLQWNVLKPEIRFILSWWLTCVIFHNFTKFYKTQFRIYSIFWIFEKGGYYWFW